jgi:hypothetical protein
MNDHEIERQLTRDLQMAALKLINHMSTNNFRIRVEGTTPPVYITLSEGRNSYSAESINYHAEQEAALAAAHEKAPSSYLARLRKVLAD